MALGDILGVTTLIFAIISIYLGIFVIKKQKPLFYKETVKIIDANAINPILNPLNQSDPNLKITYIGDPVSTLSSTYVTFWNAGNLRINKDDIPERIPLTVKAREGVRIYRFTILKAKEENSFQISPLVIPPNITYHLSFEYLAKNDGMKLQLIHSGNSNDDIEFSGKTKDYGEFKDLLTHEKKKKTLYRVILIIIMGSFLGIYGTLLYWNVSGGSLMIISFIILGIYLLFIWYGVDIILDYIYPHVPKNLQ